MKADCSDTRILKVQTRIPHKFIAEKNSITVCFNPRYFHMHLKEVYQNTQHQQEASVVIVSTLLEDRSLALVTA